jgi:hypothetical protein
MESLILNTLGFRLAVVTPKHFMKRFTSAASSDETEIQLVNVRSCFSVFQPLTLIVAGRVLSLSCRRSPATSAVEKLPHSSQPLACHLVPPADDEQYLAELTLQDYAFLRYTMSRIAAAVVLFARLVLNNREPWVSGGCNFVPSWSHRRPIAPCRFAPEHHSATRPYAPHCLRTHALYRA